jgi:hypothetical protein
MGVSGTLYLIFGIFIGVVSRIIYNSNKRVIMLGFFWIGILFCVIGIIKLIFMREKKKREAALSRGMQNPSMAVSNSQPVNQYPTSENPQYPMRQTPDQSFTQHPSAHASGYAQNHPHQRTAQSSLHPAVQKLQALEEQSRQTAQRTTHNLKSCPVCSANNPLHAHFCGNCGSRL